LSVLLKLKENIIIRNVKIKTTATTTKTYVGRGATASEVEPKPAATRCVVIDKDGGFFIEACLEVFVELLYGLIIGALIKTKTNNMRYNQTNKNNNQPKELTASVERLNRKEHQKRPSWQQR
jgi:hypothetical protein